MNGRFILSTKLQRIVLLSRGSKPEEYITTEQTSLPHTTQYTYLSLFSKFYSVIIQGQGYRLIAKVNQGQMQPWKANFTFFRKKIEKNENFIFDEFGFRNLVV